MASAFCLSITFHDREFHGRGDGGEPEWPPSPLRLLQALVAACAARHAHDQGLGLYTPALKWLEQQPSPQIIAPEFAQGAPYRLSVPSNAMDLVAAAWSRGNYSNKGDANPATHRAMKTVRPIRLLSDDTLHYLYPLPDAMDAQVTHHLELLAAAARSITHLGWGVDMVAANACIITDAVAQRLAGRRWKPVDHAELSLRVPQSGTLDALIARHQAFLQRVTDDGFTPVPPLTGFRTVAYDDTERVNHRHIAAFDLLPVDPADRRTRRPFRQEVIVSVAAMLRHTACQAAKDDLGDWRTAEWAEQFVAGHGPHTAQQSFPRFSYLPIPTLGHGDGMIRRVVIAETPGGDGRSARWAAQRLGGLSLYDQETGEAVAILKNVPPKDATFKPFLASSNCWQSITPVILPGFDDNDRGKRLNLLLRCFEQAGIPRDLIADLDVQKSPWSPASAQTRSYQRSNRLEHLPACHVRVYFKTELSGPLALGAGRHRGLGIMAGLEAG